jgi:hypothetical protein
MSSRTWRTAACAALLFAIAGARASAAEGDASKPSAQVEPMIALVQYGNVLMADPRDKDALFGSGMAWIQLGQPQAARIQLERLKAVCGQCAEAARLEAELARQD